MMPSISTAIMPAGGGCRANDVFRSSTATASSFARHALTRPRPIPPQPPSMQMRRPVTVRWALLARVRRPRVEKIPFQISNFDHVPRELAITLCVEAGIVASYAAEADGLERIANYGPLLRELGRIAGHSDLLHHLFEQIDDVVGVGVGVVRDFFGGKPAFGIFLRVFFREGTGRIGAVPPEAGDNQKSIGVAAKQVDRIGVGKDLRADDAALEALATEFLDHLAGAVRRGCHRNDIRLALQRLRYLRPNVEAVVLESDRLAERDAVGLEDCRIEARSRDVGNAFVRDVDDLRAVGFNRLFL